LNNCNGISSEISFDKLDQQMKLVFKNKDEFTSNKYVNNLYRGNFFNIDDCCFVGDRPVELYFTIEDDGGEYWLCNLTENQKILYVGGYYYSGNDLSCIYFMIIISNNKLDGSYYVQDYNETMTKNKRQITFFEDNIQVMPIIIDEYNYFRIISFEEQGESSKEMIYTYTKPRFTKILTFFKSSS